MKKIRWVQRALDGQQEVVDYILSEFGATYAMEFLEKVEKAEQIIADNPQIMPIDRLIKSSRYQYRSVIIGKRSKMVYLEREDDIIIVDFWDVRQEPGRHTSFD